MCYSPTSREDLDLDVGCEVAKLLIRAKSAVYARDPKKAADPALIGGILLHGIPGTGKWNTVRDAAAGRYASITLFEVRHVMLLDKKNVGDGEKIVEALFMVAKESAPAIIFIAEVDKLFRCRVKYDDSETANRLGTPILGLMMSEWARSGITVVGATHKPWIISQVFFRQFTSLYRLTRPSPEHVINILRAKITTILKYHSLHSDDIEILGRQMIGFTGWDIENALS